MRASWSARSLSALLPLGLICGPGLLYLTLWFFVALSRFTYPSELEWMEGGMIAHAARLVEGQPIYAPPSLDFVPFFYTPGYPALLWLLSPLTGGLSFSLGRLISICATLGLMALIYHSILRERTSGHRACTREDQLYALLGVGLYAGLYRTCGAFYDIARPDALAALFTGGVIYLGRFSHGARGALLASLLMSLAFFTKQTASVFYPAIGLYWLTRSWRSGLTYLATTLALCAGGCYALNLKSDGAFWSYVFEGHQGHVFYWKNLLLRYWRDLIFLAPLCLAIPWLWFRHTSPSRLLPTLLLGWWGAAFIQRALTLDYPVHMYYRELWYEGALPGRLALLLPPLMISGATLRLLTRSSRSREASGEGSQESSQESSPLRRQPHMGGYWLWLYIAGAGASALNHSTQWAYANCFMPLSLACALSIPHMVSDLRRWGGRAGARPLVVLFCAQWAAWGYSVPAQLPSDADHRALSQLTAHLTTLSAGRPILMPAAPLLPYQLGLGPVSTHQMGIQDVAYRGGVQGAERIQRGSAKRASEREWELIVTHEQTHLPWVKRGYFQAEQLAYYNAQTLRAKTGFLTRPNLIWLPRYRDPERWLTGPVKVNANFERHADWGALGWRAEGDAFGAGPQRVSSAGREGDFVAQSSRAGLGALSAQLALPNTGAEGGPWYLSALVMRLGPHTSRRPKLTLSLYDARGKRLSQARVTSGDVRRVNLALKALQLEPQHAAPLTLKVEDQDPSAGLWFDDVRWQRSFGAP